MILTFLFGADVVSYPDIASTKRMCFCISPRTPCEFRLIGRLLGVTFAHGIQHNNVRMRQYECNKINWPIYVISNCNNLFCTLIYESCFHKYFRNFPFTTNGPDIVHTLRSIYISRFQEACHTVYIMFLICNAPHCWLGALIVTTMKSDGGSGISSYFMQNSSSSSLPTTYNTLWNRWFGFTDIVSHSTITLLVIAVSGTTLFLYWNLTSANDVPSRFLHVEVPTSNPSHGALFQPDLIDRGKSYEELCDVECCGSRDADFKLLSNRWTFATG